MHHLVGNKDTSCYEVGMSAVKVDDVTYVDMVHVPKSYKEAMKTKEAVHWKAATRKENVPIEKNDVFDAIPKDQVPKGRKVLKCRYVYKAKSVEDGSIAK